MLVYLIIYLPLLTQIASQMDPTDFSVIRKPIVKSSGEVKTCCTAAGVVTTDFLLLLFGLHIGEFTLKQSNFSTVRIWLRVMSSGDWTTM